MLCVGLDAGGSGTRAALRRCLPGANVGISNDATIGLHGALGGAPGVAVLAGAGWIAMARAADGREGAAAATARPARSRAGYRRESIELVWVLMAERVSPTRIQASFPSR